MASRFVCSRGSFGARFRGMSRIGILAFCCGVAGLGACRFDPVAKVGEVSGPVCGNGVVEDGEQCDGADLVGNTCTSLGYQGGDLACSSDCRFEISGCVGDGVCGNGILDQGEDCDGQDLAGATCQSVMGLAEGTLKCNDECRFDGTGCHQCGNGVKEGPESCDASDFGGKTCESLTGLTGGYLTCASDCASIGANHCSSCGNGRIEGDETCDGTAVGGRSCRDYGFSGGDLACTDDCREMDFSGCTGSLCGDGICDAGETASVCPQDCGWVSVCVSDGEGGVAGHACGIRRNGTLWCWGANDSGQIGDRSEVDSAVPVEVLFPRSVRPTKVACGGAHSCVLFDNAQLWCWGKNNHGQLGTDDTVDSSAPRQVLLPDGVVGFSDLDLGSEFSCALSGAGRVWCWGRNNRGQSGGTGGGDKLVPQHAQPAVIQQFVALALGSEHACALDTDSHVWCWGRDNHGQLGDGAKGPDRSDAQKVVDPDAPDEDLTVSEITAGGLHSCAVDGTGSAICWGLNDHGQLGNGAVANDNPTPVFVDQTNIGRTVQALFAGFAETCGFDANGGLWCWGLDDHGQLGIGQTGGEEHAPVATALGSGVSTASVGVGFACAVDGNSRLWCWGRNDRGQLGNATTNDSNVPTEVVDP